MIIFAFVFFAGCYRSRSESPGDFIDFLNGSFQIEQLYRTGNHSKLSSKLYIKH